MFMINRRWLSIEEVTEASLYDTFIQWEGIFILELKMINTYLSFKNVKIQIFLLYNYIANFQTS